MYRMVTERFENLGSEKVHYRNFSIAVPVAIAIPVAVAVLFATLVVVSVATLVEVPIAVPFTVPMVQLIFYYLVRKLIEGC
jgi:hypothetical protein